MNPRFPERIVCLTEETTETLYLIGEDRRIVGVSGFTVRPPEARKKPRVSAFISARFDKILDLHPDLVIGFSDLQADIAAELVRRGVNVLVFNQRSIAQILEMMLALSRLVGSEAKGLALVESIRARLDRMQAAAERFVFRPRVFFEEWPDPLISGIRWVDELIEVAGGKSTFPELRSEQAAKRRIVDPAEVVRRSPDVVVASWCGKKVQKSRIAARPGWSAIPAVRADRIHEIKSTFILQPGPAALTDGVDQLHAIMAACQPR